MLPLSKLARSLEISATVAVAQRAQALRAGGDAVIDLSVGEPDVDTPAHVVAAGRQALESGRTRYAPAAGLPELRAAVAHRYNEDYGTHVTPEEVAIGAGAKQALYLTCRALLGRGDEALVPSPHWPTLAEAVRLAGATARLVPSTTRGGFALRARAIVAALTPRTRAVIINSPCNPTGAVADPAEMLALARAARRRDFWLLWDDTYARLVYDTLESTAPLQQMREIAGDRLVVLGTASKSYAMTGWRIGWAIGPRAVADACAALASHSTQSPATFAQVAGAAALIGPQDVVETLRAEYQRRRDTLHTALLGIPGLRCARPSGAFYLFPDVSAFLGHGRETSLELARALLEQERVAVVPGEGFDGPGHLRLSFARPAEELVEAARRLKHFLAARAHDRG